MTAGGPRSRSARPRSWSSVSQVPGSRARRSRSAGPRPSSASRGVPTRAPRIGASRSRPVPRPTFASRAAPMPTPGSATGLERGHDRPGHHGRPPTLAISAPDADLVDLDTRDRRARAGRRVGGRPGARWLHARRRHRDRPGRPARPGARAAGPHRARRRAQRDRSGGSGDGRRHRRRRRSGGHHPGRRPHRSGTGCVHRRRRWDRPRPRPAHPGRSVPRPVGSPAWAAHCRSTPGPPVWARWLAISAASVAVTLLRRAPAAGVCPPGSPVDWPRSRPPPETRPEGRRRRAWLSVGQARSTLLDARENAGLSSAEFRASEAAT